VAVSTDSHDDQCKFKEQLGAQYPMVADSEGKLVALYDAKMPLVNYAQRRTFVIDKQGQIAFIVDGNDAVDPSSAIAAVQKLASQPGTRSPAGNALP